jgi:hypothetical protein
VVFSGSLGGGGMYSGTYDKSSYLSIGKFEKNSCFKMSAVEPVRVPSRLRY